MCMEWLAMDGGGAGRGAEHAACPRRWTVGGNENNPAAARVRQQRPQQPRRRNFAVMFLISAPAVLTPVPPPRQVARRPQLGPGPRRQRPHRARQLARRERAPRPRAGGGGRGRAGTEQGVCAGAGPPRARHLHPEGRQPHPWVSLLGGEGRRIGSETPHRSGCFLLGWNLSANPRG
jgi:hypothetical protein